MSVVQLKPEALAQGSLWEYGVRFLLGGLATVTTGIVANAFGPAIGGLFLAFPALLAASATMVARHERKRKERHGLKGNERGKLAAALEARGAALGCAGMLAFALIVYM